jgi:L-lactate dehydrogenase
MDVDEKKAQHSANFMGENYLFCSKDCMTKFESNPQKYSAALEKRVSIKRKVVVVGAGQVGSTICFAMMMSGIASTIVLINRDTDLADGHVMDLNHGLSFVQPARIFAGSYSDCKGADIVVVTAGAAQKESETRLDLVRKNTEIFKDIIPKIAEHEPGILLIISNPVDILTYVALKVSGYPMNRVIGSGTTLDTARFRFLLSRHCRVDPHNVHANIIGEHGDSEVPVWSQANIAGLPLKEDCPACERICSVEQRNKIFEQVKNAGYEIINRKGYSNFGIALAVVRIVTSILRDENSVHTVSTLINNYYGISDVCLSIPTILNMNGIARHIQIDLNEEESRKFQASAEVLKGIIEQLKI